MVLNMKKILIFFVLTFLLFPVIALADSDVDLDQTDNTQTYTITTTSSPETDDVFQAKVVRVLDERTLGRSDGSKITQQNLLLRGVNGKWKNKEIISKGISDIDMASANYYAVGDEVIVSHVKDINQVDNYYINDFVRGKYLYLLAFIFCAVIFLVGKKKGFNSLLSLVVSFFIIIKLMVPGIVKGYSPLLVGVTGSLAILAVIIYLTEGWNKKSHLAIFSVLISLMVTFGLAWLFSTLTKLTGMSQEETVFLSGLNNGNMNFRGLLLTGILIGAVGVLDDIIIEQIEAVNQIRLANPNLSNKEVFKSAYEIGNTHLGAIVNTLFLTYTGASLSIILLFYANKTGTVSAAQVINSEAIATEVVRTLTGSIGIALSMPISTLFATLWLKKPLAEKVKK